MNREKAIELLERTIDIIKHAEENDIPSGMSGSSVRFNMALGLQSEPQDVDYVRGTDAIMTMEEFYSNTFDNIIKSLHHLALLAVHSK